MLNNLLKKIQTSLLSIKSRQTRPNLRRAHTGLRPVPLLTFENLNLEVYNMTLTAKELQTKIDQTFAPKTVKAFKLTYSDDFDRESDSFVGETFLVNKSTLENNPGFAPVVQINHPELGLLQVWTDLSFDDNSHKIIKVDDSEKVEVDAACLQEDCKLEMVEIISHANISVDEVADLVDEILEENGIDSISEEADELTDELDELNENEDLFIVFGGYPTFIQHDYTSDGSYQLEDLVAEIVNTNEEFYVYGDAGTVQLWNDGTSTAACY